MRDLSASDLLEIWERGASAGPLEQALVILAAAYPSASHETLAGLTVPQRDTALFHLRERTFGSRLKGLADCPACGERSELDFDAADLRAGGFLPPAGDRLPDPGDDQTLQEHSCRAAGYQVRFRLPTSADLLKVGPANEPEAAYRALLAACVVWARKEGRPVPADELPPRAIQAIARRIGKEAALADLTIAATCPACGRRWEIIFDIVSFFWNEIAAWAARILHEVHLLASTYGWRETDILAMSAWRRQRYLELIGA
jgi:hypothetical protein